jgi:hypothetical protein
MEVHVRIGLTFCFLAFIPAFVTPAGAQARLAPAFEINTGYAAFVDESPVEHFVIGGAGRFSLTPRLFVGPEITYMQGPGSDRDLFVTGNVTFNLLSRVSGGARRRANPYFVAGGGLMRHFNRFNGIAFSSTEGAFTAGAGIHIRVGNRLYIAPEVRVGWEMHTRLGVSLGWHAGEK